MSKEAYLRRLWKARVAPRPGAAEFLRSTAKLGIPFALGSLTPAAEGYEILHRSGLSALFAHRPRILREDVRAAKPDPEVFLSTARALRIEPARQLVFEDLAVGVAAARSAGSQVIAVPAIWDSVLHAELRGACSILASWIGVEPGELLSGVWCGG